MRKLNFQIALSDYPDSFPRRTARNPSVSLLAAKMPALRAAPDSTTSMSATRTAYGLSANLRLLSAGA